MELYEALATRRSAGSFAPDAPPRAVLERIIEAATWAPNHHRTEPWRFVVLAGTERERLGHRIGEWMAAQGRAPAQIESMRTKLLRSPVIIVVAQARSPGDAVRDLEDYAACACATENLLLAAHAEGLAAKWSTGELATLEPALEALGLGPDDRIVAYVYLGYPADTADRRAAERSAPTIDWRGFDE